MNLPWYWEIVLASLCLSCAYVAHAEKRWFAFAVWVNLCLYYLLVHVNVLGSDTRHLYGRINTALLALTVIVPYIAEKLCRMRRR